jgi:molecular chaperone DnaK (HSP70)/Flp pilus assembly protein TadD
MAAAVQPTSAMVAAVQPTSAVAAAVQEREAMAGTGTCFGIDLGTSSCSVAYVIDDPRQRTSPFVTVQTVDVPIDEEQAEKRSNRLPSIVAAAPGDRRKKRPLFGWEFYRTFDEKRRDSALLARGRDFFGSVKSDLGTERIYPRSVVPGCRTPAEVTALMLERLIALSREGHAARDPRLSHVVITVPASFSALAREETREAARVAGLDPARVHLLDEPIAALVDLLNSPEAAHVLGAEDRNVLVFDYGGGTCDVALVRARFDAAASAGLTVENLAISSYHRLGGDDVDRAVMEGVVWPQVASAEERLALSLATRRLVEDTLTPTVARVLKERLCRAVAARVQEDGWPAVEAEAIKVLAPLTREFAVPGLPRKTPHRFDLVSDRFREVMAPFLAPPRPGPDDRSLLGPVMETLERGGLAPERLDAVVLHGGSSLNPYVRHLMTATFRSHARFDRAVIVSTPDPLVSVARGAALLCYWQQARGLELIRPLMAEDLGIIVRSGEAVPLVTGGTALPFPDEDSVRDVTGQGQLAVPGDALPEMLVPVYTGTSRAPRLAGTIRVPLPADTPAGTPVRIKLRVDRDKTLHWWFKVGEAADAPASSINDPWCRRALTPDERRLLEQRRKMKEAVAAGQSVPAWMLAQEAFLMRCARQLDEALLAVELCLEETPEDAATHNIRGLVLDDLGALGEAERAFRAAAALAPTRAVYRGNLGMALAERGHHEEALAALSLAATLDPKLVYIHVGLGDVHRRKGDEAAARHEYGRALALLDEAMADRPFDLVSWRHLARLHQSLGDYAQADRARQVVAELEAAALYEGDPAAVVAGPDRATVAPPRVR